MAHRSGGRSHSHHSHHSHHRSHHHHSHSYSSSQSTGNIISSKPFSGAKKYMYYNRRGEQRYVYSQSMPVKVSGSALLSNLLVLIPFFIIGFVMALISFLSFQPVKPLTPVYAPTDVHIEDTIGVIDNMSSLENTLQDFEDLTGISPYVLTVYDSEWIMEYDEFWEYVLAVYNGKFNDEQHFLVAYSMPDDVIGSDVYVQFEGIQGDDTDSILTDDKYWEFYNDFADSFNSGSSVGKSLKTAFANSLDYIMENDQSGGDNLWDLFFFSIFWNGFCVVFVILTIRNFIMSRKTYQQVPMDAAYSSNAAGINNGIGQNYNAGTSSNYGTNTNNNMGSNNGTNINNGMHSNYGTNTDNSSGTYNDENTVPWDDDSRYRSEFFYNNTYTNSSNNDGSGYKNK